MKKLNLICALGIAALLTIAVNAANLVDNYSYNDGYGGDETAWNPADWNVGAGGAAGITRIFDDSADAGTNCIQLFTNDQADGTYSQVITVPASRIQVGAHTKVYWSCSYKLAASGGGGPSGSALVEVRAWDSSDGFLGQDIFYTGDTATPGVWNTTGTREWSLPANTAYLDVLADIGTWSWSKYTGVLRVDDWQVDFIPEPTMLISGLILGLAFLRRK